MCSPTTAGSPDPGSQTGEPTEAGMERLSLTCADVRLVIIKVQLVTLAVSFQGHLLQADGRTSRV
jgi:hypothetical protein